LKKMKCAKLLNSLVPMEPDKEPEAVKDLLAAAVKEAKPVAPVAVEAKAKAVKEAKVKAPAKVAKVAPVEKVVKAKVKVKEKVVEILQVPDKPQAKEPKKWGSKPPNNTLKDKEVDKAPVVGRVPVPVKVVEAVKVKVKVKAPEKVVKDNGWSAEECDYSRITSALASSLQRLALVEKGCVQAVGREEGGGMTLLEDDTTLAHQIHRDIPRILGMERVGLREVEAQLRYNIGNSAPLVRSFQEERARRRLVQRVDHVARTESGPNKSSVDAFFARPEGWVHDARVEGVAQREARVIIDATPHKIDDVVDVAFCDVSSC